MWFIKPTKLAWEMRKWSMVQAHQGGDLSVKSSHGPNAHWPNEDFNQFIKHGGDYKMHDDD